MMVVSALFLLLIATTPGFSQTTPNGGLRGIITDPSGAVVSGAAIRLDNNALNVSREIVSDANGQFAILDLTPSSAYSVTVVASGFRTVTQTNIQVISEQTTVIDVSLTIDAMVSEIEVRAVIQREELISTSAAVLATEDVVDRVYFTPLDVLKLSPGVGFIDQDENGVASSGVTIRGFQGIHGGGDIGFYLDGITLHDSGHGDGYIDTNIIIPIEIESVEIIKGPASVYYGLRSAGGTAALQAFKKGDFSRLKLQYGENETYDLQGILARADGNLDHVYTFQAYHSDGWRDNMDWNKQNVSGRWTYKFTDRFSASLNMRANNQTWNSAGTILSNMPKEAARMDLTGHGNGGERNRTDVRVWANYFLSEKSQLTFYSFVTDLNNTRWELDQGTDTWTRYWRDLSLIPENSIAGREQYNERNAFGNGLAYNFKSSLNDRDFSISIGTDFMREDESKSEYALCWNQGRSRCNPANSAGRTGPRNSQYTDFNFIFNTFALFGEVNYQVLERLYARIGLRFDSMSGYMDTGSDQITNGGLKANEHYTPSRHNVLNPKAGILYTPVDWLDIFANYGRGNSANGFSNGSYFYQNRELMTRVQYETGVTVRPSEWAELGLLYYRINTSDDEFLNPDIGEYGEYEYAGKTKREGLETSLDVFPWQDWKFHVDYSYQNGEYKDLPNYSSGQWINYSGQRLPNIFRHTTNVEASYSPNKGFGGRARYSRYSDRVNSPSYVAALSDFTQTKGLNYGTMEAQFSYRFNEKYRLVLDITNVLNSNYNRSQGTPSSNLTANPDQLYTYAPTRGRTFFFSLDVNWK